MKTKTSILEAVIKLMQTHSLNTLKVKEIAETAGISRRSFYNHFIDKYDAVNSYFLWRINQEIETVYNGNNWDEIAVFLCVLLRDNASFFLEADKAEEFDRFSTTMIRWAEEWYSKIYLQNIHKTKLTEDEKLRISFYALGNMVYVNKILKSPDEFRDIERIRHYVNVVLKEVPEIYYHIYQ